jgi:hypothetical protein
MKARWPPSTLPLAMGDLVQLVDGPDVLGVLIYMPNQDEAPAVETEETTPTRVVIPDLGWQAQRRRP